jgi:hypothetical protein
MCKLLTRHFTYSGLTYARLDTQINKTSELHVAIMIQVHYDMTVQSSIVWQTWYEVEILHDKI